MTALARIAAVRQSAAFWHTRFTENLTPMSSRL